MQRAGHMQRIEGADRRSPALSSGKVSAKLEHTFRHGNFNPVAFFPMSTKKFVRSSRFISRKIFAKHVLFHSVSPFRNV